MMALMLSAILLKTELCFPPKKPHESPKHHEFELISLNPRDRERLTAAILDDVSTITRDEGSGKWVSTNLMYSPNVDASIGPSLYSVVHSDPVQPKTGRLGKWDDYFPDLGIETSVLDPPAPPIELSGPIQFLKKLLETWHLTDADAVPLLGLDASDVTALLQGQIPLKGRDAEDRIVYLYLIRKTLFALFQDPEVENEWLREQHEMLGGQKPMDLLLEGGMENLLLVKEYVEAAAGR